MAIAPLNKFVTIAVPVAPGIQTVYTTPTGVSSIVLYASVANVGVNTYPRVSFTHERTSTATKTFGNKRNNRVVKDIEIPPNDTLVIIDGRLVLERTAIIQDSISVSGIQSGILDIQNVVYDYQTGLTTVTTTVDHGFSVGDEITMSNIEMSCTNVGGGDYEGGITSTTFPNPLRSFEVLADSVLGDNAKFETNVGIVNNIPHNYEGGGKVAPLHMELIVSILENSLA